MAEIGAEFAAMIRKLHPVEGFKMPEGVTIFGHNVTVELLLFVDILNICPDESEKSISRYDKREIL